MEWNPTCILGCRQDADDQNCQMRETMKRTQQSLKQSHEEEMAELVAENEHLHVQLADAQRYMKVR
jgi:hypothetical protein